MKNKKLLVIAGLVLVLLVMPLMAACAKPAPAPAPAPAPKPAAPIELKLALFHGSSSTLAQTYHKWESIFNEATGGRVLLKVFDTSTLVKGPEFVDSVHRGVADLALSYPPYISKTTPTVDIPILPMLMTGDKQVWDVYYGGLMELFEEEYAEHGWDNVKCLHPWYGGMEYLFTHKKQLKVPSDTEGLKLRMTGIAADFIQECGGAAAFVQLGEVYEGIQRGIVDGARGSLGNIVDHKWYEIKPMYGLDMPISAGVLVLIGNKKSLAKIPDDLKAPVDALLYAMTLDESANRGRLNPYYKDVFLPGTGLTWYTPTAEEVALWEAKVKPVIDAWIKTAGTRGQKALDIVEKFK